MTTNPLVGYAHASYPLSLQELRRPLKLSRSGGWLLERGVPGTPHRDAMGCYPLFSCACWEAVPTDLRSLDPELISVVLVTDPFGGFDPATLSTGFNRGVSPFKQHHVVDLAEPPEKSVCVHHRRNVRNVLRWLNLGAGAGVEERETDGLTRFKAGWTTHTRTAYLCRHVINEAAYAELCGSRRQTSADFFPAYRAEEPAARRNTA
jgi:hypothetical protein